MMLTHPAVVDFVNRCLDRYGGGLFSVSYDESLYSRVFGEFIYDYSRWYPNDPDIDERKVLLTPQLQVVLMYRLAHECFLLPEADKLKGDADLYALVGRSVGQMEIFYSAHIGRGLRINHGCGTVIGARCRIGDNCLIHQNCTLGDKDGGRPVLGDNVTLYAGSMVLGNVRLGDNTVVGANTVVISDFPANSILVGTPARNIAK